MYEYKIRRVQVTNGLYEDAALLFTELGKEGWAIFAVIPYKGFENSEWREVWLERPIKG